MSTVLKKLARLAPRRARRPCPGHKAAVAPAFVLYAEGRASWTPRDPAALPGSATRATRWGWFTGPSGWSPIAPQACR